MDKKLVIIIPNEQYYRISIYKKKCQSHIETIKSFVFQNDINLYGKEYSYSFTEISFELASQDYLVIAYDEIDNIKNLIIFLPKETSPNQLKYFEEKKEWFKNFNIMFYSAKEDNKMEIYDKTTTKEPIIEELLKELNNKLKNNNQKKIILKQDY